MDKDCCFPYRLFFEDTVFLDLNTITFLHNLELFMPLVCLPFYLTVIVRYWDRDKMSSLEVVAESMIFGVHLRIMTKLVIAFLVRIMLMV